MMQTPQQQEAAQRAMQEKRVKELLDGKKPIPNPLVAYLVNEMKENNTEISAVARTLQQAEQVVAQARERMSELRGIGRKYFNDINKQLDELNKKKGNGKEVAPEKPAPEKQELAEPEVVEPPPTIPQPVV